MNRAATLFLLGGTALVVGSASAVVAHDNNRVADVLARAVHHQGDLRVHIAAAEERIAVEHGRLRLEFERTERPTRATLAELEVEAPADLVEEQAP